MTIAGRIFDLNIVATVLDKNDISDLRSIQIWMFYVSGGSLQTRSGMLDLRSEASALWPK